LSVITLVNVFLLVFDGLKAEVAVPCQESALLFFPKLNEFLDCLQDESALGISELTVLTQSVQADNVAPLLGDVRLLSKDFPNLLLWLIGRAVSLSILLQFLLFFLPFSFSLFLLFTGLMQSLDVTDGLLQGACRQTRVVLEGNRDKGA